MARLLLALGSVVFALILAEGFARLFGPSWQPSVAERDLFWTYHPTLGWAHEPGTNGRFVGQTWDVHVRINSHGLRDIEHDYERQPSSARRLLLLGDSFGWGFGVEQKDVLTTVMRELCPGWEVINGSVSGYSTDQEYLFYKEEGYRYTPDLVVLLIHGNDMIGNSRKRISGYEKPWFRVGKRGLELHNVPVPGRRAWERIYTWLASNSFLANGVFRTSGVALALEFGMPFGQEAVGVNLVVTHKLLNTFARELRESGVAFRWVLVPMPQESARMFREAAESNGVPVLDLGRTFEAARRQGRELTLKIDRHWNAEGHRTAAVAIARELDCG